VNNLFGWIAVGTRKTQIIFWNDSDTDLYVDKCTSFDQHVRRCSSLGGTNCTEWLCSFWTFEYGFCLCCYV